MGLGWELCHLCDPIFGPTVPCSPGQQEPKPVGVKRSLSIDLNDLWIRTYVCCAIWRIALIKPSKWKREIPPQARGGPAPWVIFIWEWKQIRGSLCRTRCTTKEELALWKPGRKLSGSRHVGTAQGLAQERRILYVLLLSSVRLPGSNLSPQGRMQRSSPGSGSGRRVGAQRCCFCAIHEGFWEAVKCQSVVMAFLPTCVVDMPAVLLTFPWCLVWNQISAWLQGHYDCQLIFYIIYLWRWILQLLWVL